MDIVMQIIALVFAVVFHELAHGYTALYFGDDTAKSEERLSLNPLKHIDPVGSILVPAVLAFLKAPVFGWAKPVPIDFRKMRDAKRNIFFVSLAGPLTNFLCVFISYNILKFAWHGMPGFLATFFVYFIIINAILGIFNLIPIPPLDGSKLLFPFLNSDQEKVFYQIDKFGIVILLIILNLNILDGLFDFVQRMVFSLIQTI